MVIVKDPRHPGISTLMTEHHNMAILTHREIVYIAVVWCPSLWRNGFRFYLSTCRSRVRIAQELFFMKSVKILRVNPPPPPPKLIFFWSFSSQTHVKNPYLNVI